MDIEDIAKAWWTIREARAGVANLIRKALDALPPETTIGSTKLLRAICGEFQPNDKQAQSILVHIKNARDGLLLDGYFHRGKKGPTGHPLVIWHPKVTSPEEAAGEANSAAELLAFQAWNTLPLPRPPAGPWIRAWRKENGY